VTAEGEQRSWWRRALHLAPALVVLVAFALLVPKLEIGRVLSTLRDANFWLVALGVVVNLAVNVPCRVMRWWALLRPLPRKPVARSDSGLTFVELLSLLMASYATSNLLPARAGEALRTVQPHRRHGYPIGAMVASQLMEKLVEAASLALLCVPVVALSRLPSVVDKAVVVFAAVTLAGVAVVLVIARRAPAEGDTGPVEKAAAEAALAPGPRWRTLARAAWRRGAAFLRRLAQAVRLMNAPRVWLESVLWSLGSDLADVATIALCLAAVGIHVSAASWLVVLLVINLAIAVPSTPGQVGVLEAGAVGALGLLGVGYSEALAFALLYHAANVIPVTVLGVLALRRQWREPENVRT
jgi:uncharacterized protein (TIRG00374 family)